MPRLTTTYSNGLPAVNLALHGSSGLPVLIGGIVDSGADRTLLPKSLAAALGIENDALIATAHGSIGAGGTSFPTWDTAETIEAQVVAFPEAGEQHLWGPVFELAPLFAEDTTPLFGRADFFKVFDISFAQDPNLGEVFHLDF